MFAVITLYLAYWIGKHMLAPNGLSATLSLAFGKYVIGGSIAVFVLPFVLVLIVPKENVEEYTFFDIVIEYGFYLGIFLFCLRLWVLPQIEKNTLEKITDWGVFLGAIVLAVGVANMTDPTVGSMIGAAFFITAVIGISITEAMQGKQTGLEEPPVPVAFTTAYAEYDAVFKEWAANYQEFRPKELFLETARDAWLPIVSDGNKPFVERFIKELSENLLPLNGFQKCSSQFDPHYSSFFVGSDIKDSPADIEQSLLDQVWKLKEDGANMRKHMIFLREANDHIARFISGQNNKFDMLSEATISDDANEYIPFIDNFLGDLFWLVPCNYANYYDYTNTMYTSIHGCLFGLVAKELDLLEYDKLKKAQSLRTFPAMHALLEALIDARQKKKALDEAIDREEAKEYDDLEHYQNKSFVEKMMPTGFQKVHKLTPEETFYAAIKYTGIYDAVYPKVVEPIEEKDDEIISFPLKTRFEHQWIVAPSGAGKTTLIKNLIHGDLELVKANKASMIIMESKRDLIEEIRNLKVFADGQPLENKLIVLDVEDVKHPISINLLDIGFLSPGTSIENKHLQQATTQSLISYFFNSLLENSSLSGQQDTVLRYLIEAMTEIENANLDTLEAAIAANGEKIIEPHLHKLDVDARNFFETKYTTDQYTKSREAIGRRIDKIKSNKTLRRIFRATETKLNIYEAMNDGKIILINASRVYLKTELQVFGRFVVALVLSAIESRQLLEEEKRLPTYFYIDEAHDMIANDTRILDILAQARSAKVAMIIGHQWVNQMSQKVQDALRKQSSIKCMAKLEEDDARKVRMSMNMSVEELVKTPDYFFAINVKGHGSSVRKPRNINFYNQDQMSKSERATFDEKNRKTFAIREDSLKNLSGDIQTTDSEIEPRKII